MADLDPSERPLEVLPAMFNLAVLRPRSQKGHRFFFHADTCVQQLVQTGKFFRDAASHDLKDLAFARRSISKAIQPAHEKFHHALDEIEIEIVSVNPSAQIKESPGLSSPVFATGAKKRNRRRLFKLGA